MLPQPLADDIVFQYADVLRVGRLKVNGSDVSWDTSASTRCQLQNFHKVFVTALRALPELATLEESVFDQAMYWFCKGVSINYAFVEVLRLVQKKLGAMCSIMTYDPRGGEILVDYSIDILPGPVMRVGVSWKGRDNIVYCCPRTARKRVKGTLSHFSTEFILPPKADFTPVYSLRMQTKASRMRRLASTVACRDRRDHSLEEVFPSEPLRSSRDLEGHCGEGARLEAAGLSRASTSGSGEEESVYDYSWSSSLSSCASMEEAGLGGDDEEGFVYGHDEDAAISSLIDRMVEVALTQDGCSCPDILRELVADPVGGEALLRVNHMTL